MPKPSTLDGMRPAVTRRCGAVLTAAVDTHQPPGDTFWDLVRRGAQAAADKDGLELPISTIPTVPGRRCRSSR
jgi:simple sugar transport system substrate-binding protein